MDTIRFPAALLLGAAVLLVGLRAAPPHVSLRPEAMPRDYQGPRPKPRPAAEVEAVLAGAPTLPEKVRPLRVVLVAGKKDHGKGEHDYPAWQKAWAALFGHAAGVEVATGWEWPAREEFNKADVLVFYQHGDWTASRARDIDAFLARGGGLVYIHWAVDGRADAPGFARRIGLASRGGQIRYRHGPLDLVFNKEVRHPITRNFERLKLVDESYWMLTGNLPRERVLATQVEDGQPRPLFWTVEHGRGRVFVSIPGHYSWTFGDPLFRGWTSPRMVDTQLRVYTHLRRSSIMGKARRTYTPEFKAEAVRLITEQGYSVAEAARSLGVHQTLLRSWKQALEAQGEQAFPGRGKLPAIEEELRRLRADNKRLLMERDILKKAAAFFAKEAT